jgi:S1-C subfamily serine protease
MRDGKVRRSRLGVSGQTVPIDTRVRRFHGLTISSGALVAGIEPDGPVSHGELRTGDVIVALDGEPVSGVDALHRLLTEERVGRSVTLSVLRRAAMQEIVVTAGEG